MALPIEHKKPSTSRSIDLVRHVCSALYRPKVNSTYVAIVLREEDVSGTLCIIADRGEAMTGKVIFVISCNEQLGNHKPRGPI